jgi:hypothetical protein
MIERYKIRTPLERFINDGLLFKPGNRSDYISYLEFLKFFSKTDVINKHDLIIGINFTYGWMPTIFEFCSDQFEDALIILNDAKNRVLPTENNLKILKNLFNNSLVGTSKLLHFINPKVFAIWDSRVYRYITGEEPYDYRISNFQAYLAYIEYCHILTSSESYLAIHEAIIDMVGYSMTKLRTGELIMYFNGGKNYRR